MTMEVKNRNVVIDINKDVKANINLKRKRACQYAAYLSAVATSFKESSPGLGQSKKHIKTDVMECHSQEFKCCSEKAGLHNHDNFHKSCSDKAILHNYGNFRKSSLPSRVMYFWKGEWNDFPLITLAPIKEAFQAQKSVAELSIGSSLYLVDFLRMVQIDVKNGIQRSIAWIDENDKFFFPTFAFEGNCRFKCGEDNKDKCTFSGSENIQQIDVNVEIGISGTESCKSENSSEVSVTHVKSQKCNLQVLHTDSSDSEQDSTDTQKQSKVFPSCQLKQTCLDYETGDVTAAGPLSKETKYIWGTDGSVSLGHGMLSDRLIKLEEGDHEFLNVQNRFLSGLCTLATFSRIVGIYRILPSSSSGKARLQAFQNHVEITREFRGNANVKYAWHGTSRKCVSGFVLHGFGPGQIRTPKSGAAYGIGVYLAPEDCSHVSATYSDVDENGEQHMVLCRVVMGNMEQVKPGSQQFHPSNDNFDSGVDNIKNPKSYIVWSTHMNTHIHPEYVVSFKVSAEAREYWAGLRANYGIHGANHRFPSHQLQQGSTYETATIQQGPVSVKEVENKIQGPAEVPVKATSTWIFFPVLFSVIGKHLSSSSIDCLQRHYADFKKRRITRGDLIKWMRMIAGDKLVINAIKSIQSQKTGMEGFDGLEGVPHVGLHCGKVHSKSDFTLFKNKTSETGPSVLQCQNLTKPKSTINSQKFSCKDEFASHNDQAHN